MLLAEIHGKVRGLMRQMTVSSGDADRRADKFLFEHCPTLPKSAIYKAFRNKKIKRNGKKCSFDEILNVGDELLIFLPEEAFSAKEKPKFSNQNLPEIHPVFRGNEYLIVEKPCGLAVQSDHNKKACLTDAVCHWAAENNLSSFSAFQPSPCHRLDTNTTGLVVFALTPAAARAFAEGQAAHLVHKEYLCVVCGRPPKTADTVTSWWQKDEKTNKAVIRPERFTDSKEIITSYRILQEKDGLSLLSVTLGTGRSHQIRAQMAALGCPILGDAKYGNASLNKANKERFQLLSAARLTFDAAYPSSELAGKEFITPILKPVARYFSDISFS